MGLKPNTYEVKIEVIDGHYVVTEKWYHFDDGDQHKRSHQKILNTQPELLTYLQDHALTTIVGLK